MNIIQTTLELIRQKLDESFQNVEPRNERWVILANLANPDGSLFEETTNKVVMFLANLKHETIISTYNRTVPTKTDVYAVVAPTLYIDVYVLFLANFYDQRYAQGLGAISQTISFFQQNPVFTHVNLPDLDPVIDKLTFEFVNLEISELNYLMGMIGSKYLPSVYYKVRMIPFQSAAMQGQVSPARGLTAPGEA
ncbi:MAG: DUF4255 domain-containing protein [Blastocatellia bacterium]|nr:DUF4255 domain-containing protein [Blastocatellia bacterium]